MKKSRVQRLVSRKLLGRIEQLTGSDRSELERFAQREAEATIAKMRRRGYRLVTRLPSGEGVFVRDDDRVGLHVQVPSELYGRLQAECRRREVTKRSLVTAALEAYLPRGDVPEDRAGERSERGVDLEAYLPRGDNPDGEREPPDRVD